MKKENCKIHIPKPGKFAASSSFPRWAGIALGLAAVAAFVIGGVAAGFFRSNQDQGNLPMTQISQPTETQPAPEPVQPDPLPWYLTLVNPDHPLPEDFEAPELTELINDQSFDTRAYPYLQEMMDDARAEGYRPLICSSFRTWDDQTWLFDRKVKSCIELGMAPSQAQTEAAIWVAKPGTSEHQLGLAVDIVSMQYQVLDDAQADTPLQQWLMAHCWEYGFILRYPEDKTDITKIGFEPWHYRYVGKEAAKAITEAGICLEEYLQEQYPENVIQVSSTPT